MSALAMILTAALVVPGDVPEKVSGEIEERLDLRGEWEGLRRKSNGELQRFFIDNGEAWGESLAIIGRRRVLIVMLDFKFVDEGRGNFRWHWEPFGSTLLGIYKWDNDRLFLCLREAGKGRPASFQPGDGQDLLILHRVKPRK